MPQLDNTVANSQTTLSDIADNNADPKVVEYAPDETPPESADTVETPIDEDEKKPAYVANKKFKVLDQEKEMDEWLTSAIKDPETEKKARELYEKAYGLDAVKPKLYEERQARTQLESEFNQFKGEIGNIIKTRDTDLGLFFEKVNLPKEKVAQWLISELEKEEKLKGLPDHMKAAYNESQALKRANEELNQKVQYLENGTVEQAVQARTTELQSVLSRPDVHSFIQAFDARLEKPGAFRDLVIRHGKAEFDATGKDVNAEDAVNAVLRYLGHQTQVASPATKPNESATAAAAPSAPRVITAKAKPTVIPNVGSSTSSPAVKRPKSIDDLRAMAKKMQAG